MVTIGFPQPVEMGLALHAAAAPHCMPCSPAGYSGSPLQHREQGAPRMRLAGGWGTVYILLPSPRLQENVMLCFTALALDQKHLPSRPAGKVGSLPPPSPGAPLSPPCQSCSTFGFTAAALQPPTAAGVTLSSDCFSDVFSFL